eukprot:3834524-Alexandrium_andersonii.AAC.1
MGTRQNTTHCIQSEGQQSQGCAGQGARRNRPRGRERAREVTAHSMCASRASQALDAARRLRGCTQPRANTATSHAVGNERAG